MKWLSVWPRWCEVLLVLALAGAPWLLEAPARLRAHDAVVALLALVIILSSLARPRGHLHLWNLVTGVWWVLFALLESRSIHDGAAQAELLLGLSLAMFSVIPTLAMEPPLQWREYFRTHPDESREERAAVERWGAGR